MMEWHGLRDTEWMNIVNHDHAFENYSKDDAVHLAVKMTETKLKELNRPPLAKKRVYFCIAKYSTGNISALVTATDSNTAFAKFISDSESKYPDQNYSIVKFEFVEELG